MRHVMVCMAIAGVTACGGAGDDKECVPGLAETDRVCSAQGQWVQQQQVQTVQPRDQRLCPELPPGTYVLRKTLASGGLGCPVLADELLVIRSDGEAIAQENPIASSCSDSVTVDGCDTTLERSCTIEGCSAQYLFVIDGRNWTGVASLVAACPDGSGASCSYDMWFEAR